MSTFIRKAACNGRRPVHLGGLDIIRRPDLVSMLIKERKIARFIFAPFGYGKTSLAVDYCETVFGFAHVLWIKSKSPCFIRDLDAGVIARAIEEVDDEASLVVFDDVPPMDASRCEAFADQVERLLDRNCEVLIIGTPSSRMCANKCPMKTFMNSEDLLLSDRELSMGKGSNLSMRLAGQDEQYHSFGDGDSREDGIAESVASRIPALAWSTGPDDLSSFLVGAFQEEFEPQVRNAVVSMMLIGSGETLGVMDLCGLGDGSLARRIAIDYPHIGIDESSGRFDACVFPLESAVAAVRPLVAKMASEGIWETRNDMIGDWARYALGEGMQDRACDIVRLLMLRDGRGPWLGEHAWGLVRAGAFLPAVRLIDASGTQTGETRCVLMVLEAVCSLLLEDVERAVDCAKRLAFASGTATSMRLIAASLLVRHAPGALSEKAEDVISESLGNDSDIALEKSPFAVTLARGALAYSEGLHRLADYIEYSCLETPIRESEALCILSSWLFDELGKVKDSSVEPWLALEVPIAIESFVYEQIEPNKISDLNMFAASVGLALEAARVKGVVASRRAPSAPTMISLRRAETIVFGQRIQYKLDKSMAHEKKLNRLETHPDILLPARRGYFASPARRSTPVLSVRMFGRLEIAIGGEPVDRKIAKRGKVLKLFLILAINLGREINRDRICELLWPESNIEVSRKSFYNTYSLLKHALMLPDGTCPYLIRRSLSCALDDRNVETDIARLDAICREFLFGDPDDSRWSALYREVDCDFHDDLLASEAEDEFIDAARNDLRMRLVDALTTAARRITAIGIPERGIWFARSAILHDRTREDAYIALMIAQNNANQRAAAILTFVNLRKMLGEEFGVDPSPEAQRVYERIVTSDGEMVTAGC